VIARPVERDAEAVAVEIDLSDAPGKRAVEVRRDAKPDAAGATSEHYSASQMSQQKNGTIAPVRKPLT
jgi:hypothetical protein